MIKKLLVLNIIINIKAFDKFDQKKIIKEAIKGNIEAIKYLENHPEIKIKKKDLDLIPNNLDYFDGTEQNAQKNDLDDVPVKNTQIQIIQLRILIAKNQLIKALHIFFNYGFDQQYPKLHHDKRELLCKLVEQNYELKFLNSITNNKFENFLINFIIICLKKINEQSFKDEDYANKLIQNIQNWSKHFYKDDINDNLKIIFSQFSEFNIRL